MKENEVIIESEHVEINGFYGTEFSIDSINEVSLRQDIPEAESKVNALSLLRYKKGIFQMEEIGRARLFVQSVDGPYILIDTSEEIIIMNYQGREKTQEVYEELLNLTH